jgi:hypothetical protein
MKNNTPKSDPKYMIIKFLLNSLYGRFGMTPYADNHMVVDKRKSTYLDKQFKDKHEIVNIIDFNNGYELVSYSNKYISDNDSKVNVSIPIAAAISSYSRIKMSYFLEKYKDNILNIDTDGIKLDCDLDQKDVGSNLGEMKYEYTFKEFVTIAPKVYGGILENHKEIVKVKGLKNPVSYHRLKSLLYKDSKLEVNQDKWRRHLDEGYINILDEIYTLSITNNKREIIYDSTGKFVNTKPFELNNGIFIEKEPTVLYYLAKSYPTSLSIRCVAKQNLKAIFNNKFIIASSYIKNFATFSWTLDTKKHLIL